MGTQIAVRSSDAGEIVDAVDVTATLATLAKDINLEHQRCRESAIGMFQHAVGCGDLLIEAKSHLKHKEWMPWLEANFTDSDRTARVYMKIARESKTADAAIMGGVSSIRGCLALFKAEKPAYDEATNLLVQGAGAVKRTAETLSLELEPRAGLDAQTDAKWRTEIGRLSYIYHRLAEASNDELALTETVNALNEAKNATRQLYIGLEQISTGIGRQIQAEAAAPKDLV